MSDAAPLSSTWVAAVHASEDDFAPLGTAVVIDDRRVLTSAHVVMISGAVRPQLWVAFPMSEDPSAPRRRAIRVRMAAHPMADLAVMEFEESIPAGVTPAPLRCPKPADVVGRAWWAFGFADRDARGNAADGTVGSSLGYGWMRLDTDSRYPVEPGFSGGGLWCADYGAVVGVVGAANDDGDGQAIALHQADGYLPAEKLRLLMEWTVAAAGEDAQAAWGWTLARDKEADRHWRPRARGVSVASERGHRFRGRRTALIEIVSWLDRSAPDRKVLVITGSPGVGKSAVLGRIVTTADVEMRAALPLDDDAVRASVESVACAVHAKGKTALDVAMEIARAASAPLPERAEDLPATLREVLAERGGRRFNLVIDALDESSDSAQARAIITGIVLPIAEMCADVGAQMMVGTRRSDDAGDLLQVFGSAATTVDLDDWRYFAVEDLAAYAQATLQLRGNERPGNPYQPDEVAAPVAARIAQLAERNFLVAGLVARTYGLYDAIAINPATVSFTPSVKSALATFVDQLAPVADVPARELLMALAFAEAPGLPPELWQLAIRALTGAHITTERLTKFARGSAANFLVESAGESATVVFRLFHQALSDALYAERARSVPAAHDEGALTTAFTSFGVRIGWDYAPTYLFRSLPGHALRAEMIDKLLSDIGYVLRADLRRLIPAAAHAHTRAGSQRAHVLRLTPRVIAADPPERLALLSVTETLDDRGTAFRHHGEDPPYQGVWANTPRRAERAILDGHTGGVNAVCAVRLSGRELLVSAGADRTVRVWDPATGAAERTLEGHTDWINGVCAVRAEGRELLASAGADATVRIWDPATGALMHTLKSHTESAVRAEGRELLASTGTGADATVRTRPLRDAFPVNGVCAVWVEGRELLASAGADATVRIWDPATGALERTLKGHTYPVNGVCAVRVEGRELLASAGADRTVRIWDPATGVTERSLDGHGHWVTGVCAVQVEGRELLASAGAGADATVRIWDPATGALERTLKGHADGVSGVYAVRVEGRKLLASAGADRTVRIWDPATGSLERTLKGHADGVSGVCAVRVESRELLASAGAGADATVRIWDPAIGAADRTLDGQTSAVGGVCAVRVEGRELLAGGGADAKVRIWHPATGVAERTLEGHTSSVRGVCAVRVDGRELLASAGADRTVRIWDLATGATQHTSRIGKVLRKFGATWGPATGAAKRILKGHTSSVRGVCAVRVDGRELLASAGADATVRIWDPATGAAKHILKGHVDGVSAVCSVRVEGRELLASAGVDRTVRIWDPTTGAIERILDGHVDGVSAVCSVRVEGRELLASASADRTVRIWDPTTGAIERTLDGHTNRVNGVCPVRVDGSDLLASASADRTVRIWDPATSHLLRMVPVHYQALGLTLFENGHLVVANSAGLLTLRIT